MRLGAVRRRQAAGRREPLEAQDVDRAQAHHLPSPGSGWRNRAAAAGWEPGLRERVSRGEPMGPPGEGQTESGGCCIAGEHP